MWACPPSLNIITKERCTNKLPACVSKCTASTSGTSKPPSLCSQRLVIGMGNSKPIVTFAAVHTTNTPNAHILSCQQATSQYGKILKHMLHHIANWAPHVQAWSKTTKVCTHSHTLAPTDAYFTWKGSLASHKWNNTRLCDANKSSNTSAGKCEETMPLHPAVTTTLHLPSDSWKYIKN